jgi:hypothetical protein
MGTRRQSSQKSPRTGAHENGPSTSARLADIENAIHDIRATLDVQFKRIAAVQAQLDHLAAKVSGG